MKLDICRLCKRREDLMESHIIPKFIFKSFKQTSATGKLRFSFAIDKPVQDGLKLHWLCSSCEQMIGNWETYFADNIFYPLQSKSQVVYGRNFLKFAVSLSWRVLTYFIDNNQINHLSDELQDAAKTALSVWKEFLFDRVHHPGKYEQHFYNFLGEMAFANLQSQSNIHRYLQRSIEIDVLSNNDIAFVYIKLTGFLFIGYITERNLNKWRKTRISEKGSKIGPMNYEAPKYLWEIFQEKAANVQSLQKSISQKQQEKIDKNYQNSTQKVAKSETIKSLAKDINLFGLNLVFPENPEDSSK